MENDNEMNNKYAMKGKDYIPFFGLLPHKERVIRRWNDEEISTSLKAKHIIDYDNLECSLLGSKLYHYITMGLILSGSVFGIYRGISALVN